MNIYIYIYIYVDICSSRRGDGSQDFVKFNYSPSPERKKNSKGRILFSIFAIDGWQDPGINDSFKKKSLFTNKKKKIGE